MVETYIFLLYNVKVAIVNEQLNKTEFFTKFTNFGLVSIA